MSETQVLVTVSDFFLFFFLGIISWKGALFSRSHFLEGGFTFQWGGASFLIGGALHEGGISFDGGRG